MFLGSGKFLVLRSHWSVLSLARDVRALEPLASNVITNEVTRSHNVLRFLERDRVEREVDGALGIH